MLDNPVTFACGIFAKLDDKPVTCVICKPDIVIPVKKVQESVVWLPIFVVPPIVHEPVSVIEDEVKVPHVTEDDDVNNGCLVAMDAFNVVLLAS